ncbi:MAG TPA: galactokinase family protein, partial [Actinomycetes bacterium]|nr:galactokinase family protein [Actinomycetes bacterium]
MTRNPPAVWRAPGRVNLIGDHTDHSGGFVLPFAIQRGVTVRVSPRDDGMLTTSSEQMAGSPV